MKCTWKHTEWSGVVCCEQNLFWDWFFLLLSGQHYEEAQSCCVWAGCLCEQIPMLETGEVMRDLCKISWGLRARLGQLGSVRDGCIYMNHFHTSRFEKVQRCVGLSRKADEDLWGRTNFRFKWSRKLVWVWGISGVWAGIFRLCVQAVSHTSVSTGHYLLPEQMVRN